MHIETPEPTADPLKALITAAREHLEDNDPAAAVAVLRTGLPTHAGTEKFCFEFGYALYEAGQFDEAAQYLRKAIKLDPHCRPQKYFTLAQISEDKAARELYQTGLGVSGKTLTALASKGLAADDLAGRQRQTKRQMAQAHCALAQLEEKKLETGKHAQFSEPFFLKNLSEAAAIFPFYLETYLLGAMYYYNCQNEALWGQAIAAMIGQIRAMEQSADEELDEYGCAFFLPLLRIMVECQMWPEVAVLAEVGLANDGANLEGNYLLAFSLFYQDKFADAEEVLDRLKELKVDASGDQELLDGYLELRAEVDKKKPFEDGAGAKDDPNDADWQSDDQEDA